MHNLAVLTTLACASVMIATAAAAQAITGFGFAMLAVPLLALVTPIDTAVVAAGAASLALTTGIALTERAHVQWTAAVKVAAASAVGLPVGLFILKDLPSRALTMLVGTVVLASIWIVWRRPALSSGWPTLTGVGVLVGILTTATGTNGPPMVAAFQSLGYSPRAFRATLAAVFTACGLVSVALFATVGEFSSVTVALALSGLPAAAGGWWLGDRVFRRLPLTWFRALVLIALTAASAITIVRSFI